MRDVEEARRAYMRDLPPLMNVGTWDTDGRLRKRLRAAVTAGDVTGACVLLRMLHDPEERLRAYTEELCERRGIRSDSARAYQLELVRRRLADGEMVSSSELDNRVLHEAFDDAHRVWAALTCG